MLGNDDFGFTFVVVSLFTDKVVFLTMDEHDDIRILFDRPRLAQVAKARAVVLGCFRLAIKLRQTEYRHVEFSRQTFQAPGDLGHLFGYSVGDGPTFEAFVLTPLPE